MTLETKIVLEYPVEVDGEKVTSLTMRRPKVRDLKAAEKCGGSDADKETFIFASLTDTSLTVIDSLDLLDLQLLQGAYSNFLSRSSEPSGKKR